MTNPGKRLSLWHIVLLSLIGYSILPFVFPFIPHYNDLPLSDIRSFTPSLLGGLGYFFHFVLLYLLYLIGWQLVRRRGATLAQLLLVAVLFCIPLLFTYPINATDLFRYFVRGRITAIHDQSSLTVPPSAIPDDPFAPLAGQWADETSPYGPVWELIAAGVTILSGQNLLIGLIIFKTLGIAAHLFIGVLLWKSLAATSIQQRAAHTLLWIWNPALLYAFVIDAHNDALMLLWLLLGYWVAIHRRRPLAGFLLALLSPLTKMIGALAVPFLFLQHWRTLPSWAARLRFLLKAVAGSLVLTAVAFLPFGSPFHLIVRLLEEASGGAGFSPGVVLLLLAEQAAIDLPLSHVTMAGMLILLLIVLILLWRTWQGRPAIRGAADAFAFYLITALTFRIWYSAWPFAWLLLDRGHSRRLWAGIWFLLTTQLSVIIYGHIRVYLLRGDMLVAHLIGVPFTFLLPLLLAYAVPSNPRSDTRQTEI